MDLNKGILMFCNRNLFFFSSLTIDSKTKICKRYKQLDHNTSVLYFHQGPSL